MYGHPVDRNGELHLGHPDALGLPQLLVKLQFSTRLFHHIHPLGLVHRSAAQKLPKNTLHINWCSQKHPKTPVNGLVIRVVAILQGRRCQIYSKDTYFLVNGFCYNLVTLMQKQPSITSTGKSFQK